MRGHGHRLPAALAVLVIVAAASAAQAASVWVSPSTASLSFGSSRRFVASVNGRAGAPVAWSVNGIAGGNAQLGVVDANGTYTAPAAATPGTQVSVRATSVSYPSASAAALVTLRSPTPLVTAISPATLSPGPFTIQVAGSQFAPGAVVRWNGVALATTFNSATQLTASGSAAQAGWHSLTVVNPGGSLSPPVAVRVVAPTRTPTVRSQPSPTASRPRTATRTATLRATATPSRATSPTRTRTVPPTATIRIEPTRTRTATVVPSATRTATFMPSATAMAPTRTRTATAMPSATPMIATRTPTAMATATMRTEPMRTATPTMMMASPSRTPSAMPSATRAGTAAATVTGSPVRTPTGVPSAAPTPNPLAVMHGRLLDQASFGPTQALFARLAQIGIPAFIDEQLALPESPWPAVATATRNEVVDAFFGNALNGQDQLRQRLIYALSEILVVSSNKNTNPEDIVPWLRLLSRNAFGNYRTLLRELTLDASMGKFLDLANSGMGGGAANENYPREVMQLFSIGLQRLNLDGTLQLNAQNAPIPTYTQADVEQLARALTGWTYGNPSGTPPSYRNSNYYPGPMLPVEAYHDRTAKLILGVQLPAGQSATQDLDDAIDVLFEHPNVGPFLATRLIRALVTSNPSPAYVARVASAFNGSGTRGDMKAVIRAVLLDPEARNDVPPASFGRLRTPVQHTIALARALGLNPGSATQFAYLFEDMHEGLLNAPSVFGHYSPLYRIPMSALFGPEFQIYSASDAINRANLFYWFMYSPWPLNPALQRFVPLAGNAAALVNAVDETLLYGRMLPATRNALLAAMPAMPDNNARVMTAVYLTSMSGEYLIQR